MSRGTCRHAQRQPRPPSPPRPTPVEIDFLGLLTAPAPPADVVNDNVPRPSNNAAAEPQVNDCAGEEADGSVSNLNLTLRL